MVSKTKNFSWFFAVFAASVCAHSYAAMPVNPRATDSDVSARQSLSGDVSSRRAVANPTRIRAIGPTRVNSNGGRSATTITAVRVADTPNLRAGSATRSALPVARARSARTATASMPTNARIGKKTVSGMAGIARSASAARATAVFNDVSKIGSGYAACRESYSTCMDQMCANANDTYRRCFCSDRFVKFREIEDSLDQAMIMLQDFQDNNLNAVDKTAAEVEAMYSATVGELAIKRDTSAAAKTLDAISDLLSGKSNTTYSGTGNSIGILDLNFSTDLDDIWSNDVSSIFSSTTSDISSLEGSALFNAAQRQCVNLSAEMCSSNSVATMARSSYNILITQDCNTYEKTLNKKRETVASAVRMAEKYLREARLEEYRAHNSADVNECIANVRNAILADTACGANYKRCLDPTGAYINGATGDAIYSPRLFQLEQTIALDGVTTNGDVVTDIIGQNPTYSNFLETYRKYAAGALDTCRDIADFVWTEFKRNAIIEIAQAQTEKIEEVKSSCVNVISECYDTQTNALKNVDKNTATTAAALARYAAGDMCRERVVACATLWGNREQNSAEGCKFDSRGHLTNSGANCGLTSLLNYVSAVDSLSVAEKCIAALDEYVQELCTPDSTYSYPYKCRRLSKNELTTNIQNFAASNCADPANGGVGGYTSLPDTVISRVDWLIRDVDDAMSGALADVCTGLGGMWAHADTRNTDGSELLLAFYDTAFGGNTPPTGGDGGTSTDRADGSEWGYCFRSSAKLACEYYQDIWGTTENPVTRWDEANRMCIFNDSWYEHKCAELGTGYYLDGVCYISSSGN